MTVEEKRTLLKQLLQAKMRRPEKSFHLSYGQKALWFLQLLAPGMASYNTALPASVSPALDLKALQGAFDHVLRRHEALRSVVTSGEPEPMQEVRTGTVQIQIHHVCNESPEAIHEMVAADHRRPFQLDQEMPIRASVYRASGHDVLLVTVHHIAFDGWSASIFMEDLRQAYTTGTGGAGSPVAPLATTYRDYINWQREMLKNDEERLAEYWTKRLAGELPVLRLPSPRQRPAINSFSGGAVPVTIGESLMGELRQLAKQERTTLFSVLLAAWTVFLAILCDSDEVITGVPVSGRTRPEWMPVIGYFVNSLPIRLRLMREHGLRGHVREAAQAMQEALTHQDYPFSLMVEKMKIRRDTPGSPVFQTMLNLHRARAKSEFSILFEPNAEGAAAFGASRLYPHLLLQQEGQFDLVLELLEGENFLVGNVKYSHDAMDEAYATRVREQFLAFLNSAVSRPDESVILFGRTPGSDPAKDREEMVL